MIIGSTPYGTSSVDSVCDEIDRKLGLTPDDDLSSEDRSILRRPSRGSSPIEGTRLSFSSGIDDSEDEMEPQVTPRHRTTVCGKHEPYIVPPDVVRQSLQELREISSDIDRPSIVVSEDSFHEEPPQPSIQKESMPVEQNSFSNQKLSNTSSTTETPCTHFCPCYIL